MAWRELATGAGCSADGASGSGANPAASFANALLGGTAKAQEGLLRPPQGARGAAVLPARPRGLAR